MANGKNSGDGTDGDKGEASEGNSDLSLLILDRLNEFHKDVKKDIKDLKLNYKELCDNINSFKAEIKANFGTINEEIEKLKTETSALKEENSQLKKSLNTIQVSMEQCVQHSLHNKVKLLNLPESVDALNVLLNISVIIGFEFKHDMIKDVYRSKPRPNIKYFPPLMISFFRNSDKINFLNSYKNYIKNETLSLGKVMVSSSQTSTDGSLMSTPIKIFEQMSPYNYKLYQKAKEYKRDLKYVWFQNNRLLVRKDDSAPIIHIKSENDLLNLLGQTPSTHIDESDVDNKSDCSSVSTVSKRKPTKLHCIKHGKSGNLNKYFLRSAEPQESQTD